MIYLDHQATTPADERVVEAMSPWWSVRAANAHSSHAPGVAARDAVEGARHEIAKLIGAERTDVVFTSGATEACNLALRGFLRPRDHVITSTIEHSCVRETIRILAKDRVTATEVPVDGDGVLDVDAVEAAIRPETTLVSIHGVNNEIGTIQPIADIGAGCSRAGIVFHTDAAQAAGKIPLDVIRMRVDMLSLSSHKLYGPQGIGALYVGEAARSRLKATTTGGGQERGLRSGTLPTALCVGFGEACRIASEVIASESARLTSLRAAFLNRINSSIDDVQINGSIHDRIAGNLNLLFIGVDAESLLYRLPDVALSTGSACSSAAMTPSHVLLAIGLSREEAQASVRVGFGRSTTEADVVAAADRIAEEVKSLRLTPASRRVAATSGSRKRRGL